MPRLARIDIPGLLQHVIIRGIKRRDIFKDDIDRQNFLDRVTNLSPKPVFVVTPGQFYQSNLINRTGETGAILEKVSTNCSDPSQPVISTVAKMISATQ